MVFSLGVLLLGGILFIVCRIIFFCLFKYKISFAFRTYSFGFFILEYLFLANLSDLTFLAVRNFEMLFRIGNGWMPLISQATFLVVSGFIFISLISLPFIYLSFYGKLSKYFLVNMYRINGSLLYSVLRFFFKPLIVGAIQASLYNHL